MVAEAMCVQGDDEVGWKTMWGLEVQ